jgi:hypothetical protein
LSRNLSENEEKKKEERILALVFFKDISPYYQEFQMKKRIRKMQVPIPEEKIRENLKRFREGKPLTIPLKILGRHFKQRVYHKFPTPEVRKTRRKANQKYFDKWNSKE